MEFTCLIFFFLIFCVNLMVETARVKHDFIIRNIPSNLDGFPRPVVIMCHADSSWDIDRSFPCPLIRAKLRDQFRINITKLLRNQSITIHFHDLHMLNNPWVGCTVHNTQCSIDSYGTFPCEFNLNIQLFSKMKALCIHLMERPVCV